MSENRHQTDRMTRGQFSMQAAYLAKEAASWAGDLAGPGEASDPADREGVSRFTAAIRRRLLDMEEWAGVAASRDAGTGRDGAVWQPIETAPKDGTDILLGGGHPGPPIRIAAWGCGRYLGLEQGYERDWVRSNDYGFKPTHWMPLPEPPVTAIRALPIGSNGHG